MKSSSFLFGVAGIAGFVSFIVGINVLVGVVLSYPSSYLFDFAASQIQGCAVRVENPIYRTGLGIAGGYAGGVGLWGSAIAKIWQNTAPASGETFNKPCQ